MNNAQRKQIAGIQKDLEAPMLWLASLRGALENSDDSDSVLTDEHTAQLEDAVNKLEDAAARIEELREEEEDKFDNMPESLQSSEKGEALEAAKDALTEAFDTLDMLVSDLGNDISSDTTCAEASEILETAEETLDEVCCCLDNAVA